MIGIGRAFVLALFLAAANTSWAQSGAAVPLQLGKNYREIAQQPVADPGRIEVIDFFFYGCPFCNELRPMLERWRKTLPVDVVFPVLHGPLCEDGSIQGLFELAQVAYVGSGVLGSAICMDKDVAKRLVSAAGIDTAEYVCVRAGQWPALAAALEARVRDELGYPVFVKPANLGSSVGVTRVQEPAGLSAAVAYALQYDEKVIVERAVDAREIELAVLSSLDEGAPPDVSVAGEIVPKGGFYDYESKYLDPDGAALHVPAQLTPEQSAEAQRIAQQAFTLLECDGMARIDLFLDRKRQKLLFNEVNTIPGFTTISMYPKLWEASGIPYRQLLARLIDLAVKRGARRKRLERGR